MGLLLISLFILAFWGALVLHKLFQETDTTRLFNNAKEIFSGRVRIVVHGRGKFASFWHRLTFELFDPKRRFIQIARKAFQGLGRRNKVVLVFPKDPISPEMSANRSLFIHFGAHPDSGRQRAVPQRLWDTELGEESLMAYVPHNTGITVIDSERWTVGEWTNQDNFYIYYPCLTERTSVAKSILQFTLSSARELRNVPKKDLDLQRLIERETQRRESVSDLVEGIDSALNREVELKEQRLLEAAETVQSAEAAVDKYFAQTNNADLILKVKREVLGQDSEHLRSEIDRIKRMPEVAGVRIENNKIVVSTKELTTKNSDRSGTYFLGCYRIEIPLDTSAPSVYMYNCSWHIDGMFPNMQGLRILPSGLPIASVSQSLFPELLGRREYAKAAKTAIKTIKVVDPNDPTACAVQSYPPISLDGLEEKIAELTQNQS